MHVNDQVQEKSMKNDKEADFKTILNHLQSAYCGKIAYEFMHLPVRIQKTTKKIPPPHIPYSLLVNVDGGIMLLKVGKNLNTL